MEVKELQSRIEGKVTTRSDSEYESSQTRDHLESTDAGALPAANRASRD